jgi:hypothetical protein
MAARGETRQDKIAGSNFEQRCVGPEGRVPGMGRVILSRADRRQRVGRVQCEAPISLRAAGLIRAAVAPLSRSQIVSVLFSADIKVNGIIHQV